MSSPFFSVIIPTLNEEKFLPVLLSCLRKQTEKNFEVIVVDGNSDDNTQAIALKNKTTLYKVRIRNVSFQRNYGGERGHGKYLVFLDADVVIQPGFLKKLRFEIMKRKGLFFIPSIRADTRDFQTRAIFRIVNQWVQLSVSTPKPFVTSGSIIVERNFFNLIGGFNPELFVGEDHSLVQTAAEWGVRAVFLSNVYLTFSLRRIKREGIYSLFARYFFASAHIVFKGGIKKKIYEYEMGGHLYNETPVVAKQSRKT